MGRNLHLHLARKYRTNHARTLSYHTTIRHGKNPIIPPLVYVASFSGGDLRIFNADTLAPIATASIGLNGQFINVATANGLGLALVVSHRDNKLTVANGLTGAEDRSVGGPAKIEQKMSRFRSVN